MKIEIKKLRPKAILPQYQTDHSAGMDLHACIDESVIIKPGKRALAPTGLSISLPDGYEAQVRARSGLAIKNGISLVNGVGTIDADYRGEICVALINLGEEDFTVNHGDRIAQFVINKFEKVQCQEVAELDETARGSGGFGSTGTS